MDKTNSAEQLLMGVKEFLKNQIKFENSTKKEIFPPISTAALGGNFSN
jgi:hypothetical protein